VSVIFLAHVKLNIHHQAIAQYVFNENELLATEA